MRQGPGVFKQYEDMMLRCGKSIMASILELNGSERYSCCNLHAVISPLFAYLQAILGTSDMLCTCERVATGEVREGNGRDSCRLAGRCLYNLIHQSRTPLKY